jgi:acyl-CoA synthetase (AMP-forming)/AMP-acid ligase II
VRLAALISGAFNVYPREIENVIATWTQRASGRGRPHS